MSDGIDDLPLETSARRWPSAVWLVPLLAIAIALGVAWQNYANQGPLIEVTFDDASGVHARETELRYRDIAVGLVERVAFSDGLDKVTVLIRLDQSIAPFVDENAGFWVVRPEVTTQGVTGLDTVLSGVYIAGDWDGDLGTPASAFVGLSRPPLLTGTQEGTVFALQASSGLPPASTPILYRGVEVGQIGAAEIAPDGLGVTAPAVIYAPHDRLISSATRFWDISGVSFSLGASGASLDFSSLASLISGAVTFETLDSGGTPLAGDAVFELFADEETARERFLIDGETGGFDLQVIFPENIPGLGVGAAVTLGGVRLGEVTSIAGVTDEARFGDGGVRLSATLRLVPARIGFASENEEADFLDFLDRRIASGLRARLANASLLTGGLLVELIVDPAAEPDALNRTAQPFPQIPAAAANVTDVSASAQGLLQRVEALPVEDVLEAVISFLNASTALVRSEDIQAVPGDLRATLFGVRTITESEALTGLPSDLAALTAGLSDVVARTNTILAEVETAALVADLNGALESFAVTAARLPGLADQAAAVLTEAEQLSLQELFDRVSGLVDTTEALVAQDATQALPSELNAALGEVQGALAELRAGGLIDNANSTLLSARDAAEALAQASAGLPALSARLTALAADADATLVDYGRDGALGRDITTALRQIEAAAASFDRLARQISRNPNSLLTGR